MTPLRLLSLIAAAFALALTTVPGPAHARGTAAAAAVAGKKWRTKIAVTPEGGVRMGNPKAKVKLVEYGARTCPACAAFAAEAMQPLIENYVATGKLSFEFRDFLVHGTPDLPPALLNRCVPLRRFFDVLERLFADQPSYWATFRERAAADPAGAALARSDDSVAAVDAAARMFGYSERAAELGLAPAKAAACLADTDRIAAAVASTDAGDAMGINGTPTFLIDGEIVAASDWATLEPLLAARLAE